MSDDHGKAKTIFLRAAEIAAEEERQAFLEAACGGDDALRSEVEDLLRHQEQLGAFLEPAPGGQATVDGPTREAPGTVIGPYKLLQQIGEGGMGTVYMAEQTQPVQRKVALKVIKAGMDSRSVIARFEAERQALALMDHPHIAKVLDAGTTQDGRPYFIMELVKGVPITRYCDERHLTPRERLELFVPVCQAVQHAHQKGIIHRDLKPSNVMVCLYDGKPVPKVIDFGVAKAASQKLTEKTMFTEVGQVIGTLEYMAPEQAELNNLDIDTRADIYSLGVLLYELLTGTTPLERKRLKEVAFREALRLICEEEPPKPSTRLSTGEGLAAIAVNRGMEPSRLSRQVCGELDWIVMKTLEKDRNRRYETADGLARDVERYLRDEPVQACPPLAGYRLRKFIRRNRGPVLATTLLIVVLVGGVVGTSMGFVHAVAERDEKERARLEALANERQAVAAAAAEKSAKDSEAVERKQAELVATLLESVFRDLDPKENVERTKDQLVRRLDEVAANLDRHYAGQPQVRARLRNALGLTQLGLGEYGKAVALFEKAVEERRTGLGADDEATLTSMSHLALAYKQNGQLDKALPLGEETLNKRKAKLGPNHRDTLTSMDNLASMYQEDRRLDKALLLLEESLERSMASRPPGDADTLVTVNNLAGAYRDNGQIEKAKLLLTETLEKMEAKLGPNDPATLQCMNNLAVLYQDAGQLDKAIPLLVKTLERQKARLSPDHPETLVSMNNLAMAYKANRQLDKALPLFVEALEGRKANLGPKHPSTLESMGNLATAYQEGRQFDKALPLFKETLSKRQARLGYDHPLTLRSMNNLAAAYWTDRKLDLSIPLFEEALRLLKARLGPEDVDTLRTMANLGVNYRDAGRLAEAIPILEEAWERAMKRPGPLPAELAWIPSELEETYHRGRQLDKVERHLVRTLEFQRRVLSEEHPDTILSMNNLAGLYHARGNFAKAEPLFVEALKIQRRVLGLEDDRTLSVINNLAGLYQAQGKFTEAESLFVEALEMQRCVLGEHDDTILSLGNLAALYVVTDQLAKAEPLQREALEMSRQLNGEGSPPVGRALAALGNTLLKQHKYAEAEPLLRECLKIRERQPNDWRTSNTKSLLGNCLMGQKKYADAEPLLLAGYEGMKQRESQIPLPGKSSLTDALQRLVLLYDALGQKDKADEWRKKLPAVKSVQPAEKRKP